MELIETPNELVYKPISELKKFIVDKLGNDWCSLELETISYELGYVFPEVFRDKLLCLKLLAVRPESFYTDLMAFVFSVETINDNQVDFGHIPFLTSLEIVYAILEVQKVVTSSFDFSEEIENYINLVLTEEGFSKVPSELNMLKDLKLTPGQTNEDIRDKEIAIRAYVLSKSKGVK